MSLKRIKAQPRTAEELAEEQRVRQLFQDRPSVKTLIERSEIDPERIMTGTAEESLLKALSALSHARQSRGLSLSEIARRSGIDLASLSRLETGKNPNPTFETLSRYADAMGLRPRAYHSSRSKSQPQSQPLGWVTSGKNQPNYVSDPRISPQQGRGALVEQGLGGAAAQVFGIVARPD